MKITLSLLLILLTLPLYGQLSNTLSPADKLYGLSKFWMEVNSNFVYLEQFGKARWDSLYRATIPSILATTNDYEYCRELQKFCAVLHDGHTTIFPPYDEGNSNFGSYRIGLMNVQNRAIIGAVNLSKKDEVPVGSEIVEVNGKPTGEYIRENVAPYIATSAPHIREDLCIERLLRGIDGERYEVKVRTPEGKILPLSLVHAKVTEKETYPPRERKPLFDFKWYDGRIAYVALNSFSNPAIDSLFMTKLPELYTAKALIIDLRNNGGGSTHIGYRILKYLTDDSLLFGARGVSRNHIPVFKAWGQLFQPGDTSTGNAARGLTKEEVKKYFLSAQDKFYYDLEYTPEKDTLQEQRVVIPTVILIGHQTASAAEDFLIATQNQKHIVLIGEKTYGSTGQPYEFTLPGNLKARVCALKVTYPDGTPFVGVGIKPEIEVSATLDDYLNNTDPALEKGLSYLKEKLGGGK